MTLEIEQAERLMHAATGESGWRFDRFTAGKFSDVFLASRGPTRRVLRVAPPDAVEQLFYEYRMMRREPAIHEALRARTDAPVAAILHADFGRERVNRDWMVMEALPGEPLSGAPLSAGQTRRAYRDWGAALAAVHTVTAPDGRFGYRGDPDCMDPQPSWPEAFALMYRKLLDDVAACGVYSPARADDAAALLEAHLDSFAYDGPPRLLHGDTWQTNLLVDADGAATGLLDFDRACWGDPEWDLAIAEYCGVTNEAFWQGFGRRIEPTRDAAIRRMFYLLYEHQKYIPISAWPTRRDDPAGATRYARQSLAVMDAFRRTGEPGF